MTLMKITIYVIGALKIISDYKNIFRFFPQNEIRLNVSVLIQTDKI